jgi:UDP-glucose 4-epimerase
LRTDGRPVRVLDDLSSGHREFVPAGVALVEGSVTDPDALRAALHDDAGSPVEGVVHLAAFKYAGVSVDRPLHTYEQNIVGTLRLLEAMTAAGVDKLVFSSSAAVYGTPDVDLVTEDTPTRPESPYGRSKLVGEWLIADAARATGTLRHTSLRYFNVVGSGDPSLYDSSPHNLFPLVLKAISEGRRPRILGTDYPTPDGTTVRDYVDVADLARTHAAAAAALAGGRELLPAYNLGSGTGLSVREVVALLLEVTGSDLEPEEAPRRPGDPARIVASGAAAARDLGWEPTVPVREMAAGAARAQHRVAHAQAGRRQEDDEPEGVGGREQADGVRPADRHVRRQAEAPETRPQESPDECLGEHRTGCGHRSARVLEGTGAGPPAPDGDDCQDRDDDDGGPRDQPDPRAAVDGRGDGRQDGRPAQC